MHYVSLAFYLCALQTGESKRREIVVSRHERLGKVFAGVFPAPGGRQTSSDLFRQVPYAGIQSNRAIGRPIRQETLVKERWLKHPDETLAEALESDGDGDRVRFKIHFDNLSPVLHVHEPQKPGGGSSI